MAETERTHKGRRSLVSDERLAEVLAEGYGILSNVSALLEQGDKTHQPVKMTATAIGARVRRSEALQAARQEGIERALDFAESKLVAKIAEGDMTAICFFLKCKGKERGYVEKQTIDLTGKLTLTPSAILSAVQDRRAANAARYGDGKSDSGSSKAPTSA